MTITLAAVYAPIGLQGGLTGTLFPEFALTLASAVVMSSIVALTLSPIMASKLLVDADGDRGFRGFVNRRFDAVRYGYGRVLSGTLNARPAVYLVWAVIGLITVPMFMFSPKELAPSEDQNVIFSIINAPANASADKKSHF
jgi:multidrug efflux pump